MADAQDQHTIARLDLVENDVRLVAMGPHPRIDFLALPCGIRIFGQKGEGGAKPVVIGVGLPQPEPFEAVEKNCRQIAGGADLKKRMRTGTVVTTDDRNWELRYTSSALRFSQSRAVAIDMESATLAAQGFRFRVPYGTLLCVSDKPIHGEIKLPGQANRFYERAIAEHLRIGIAAIDELKLAGNELHSRKLRAFNEPPFR